MFDRRAQSRIDPCFGQTDALWAFFRSARWLTIVGLSGASLFTVMICWNIARPERLLAYLAVHQLSVVLMAITFTSPYTTSRRNASGLPKFARASIALSAFACGSVLWFDMQALQNQIFLLSAMIVLFATSAGAMITMGPLKTMAQPAIFSLLIPSAMAAVTAGYVAVPVGTMFFLLIVAIFGITEMHNSYNKLIASGLEHRLRAETESIAARSDTLTGLHNRIGIEMAMSQQRESYGALMFIDLDHFKQVNDSAGHRTGDILLKDVAARMRNTVADAGVVGRIGGDEFLILLKAEHCAKVESFANSIVRNLEVPFLIDDGEHRISASIGVAVMVADTSFDQLLHESDTAMYSVKRNGKSGYAVATSSHLAAVPNANSRDRHAA